MKTYATMAGHQPDFFIHSGDTVYCDGPIAAEQAIAAGGMWKNFVAEGVGTALRSFRFMIGYPSQSDWRRMPPGPT